MNTKCRTPLITNNRNIINLDGTNESNHNASILRNAILEFNEGSIKKAWELIDRYCRVELNPKPSDYVFRAQILHQIGQQTLSIRDLERALKIEPENVGANRRLLAWAQSPCRRMAGALNLLRSSNSPGDLIEAGKYIIEHQELDCCIKLFTINNRIRLKAISRDAIKLELQANGSSDKITEYFFLSTTKKDRNENSSCREYTISETEHDWTDIPETIEIKGTCICGSTRESKIARMFLVECENPNLETETWQEAMARANREQSKHIEVNCRPASVAKTFPIIVIIPVYGDFESLKECLRSLKKSDNSSQMMVVLINDATPEPKITRLLDAIHHLTKKIKIITNNENLGFVRSVNAGLKYADSFYPYSDVILLNSDTIVPPKFADHLMETAYKESDIGTVTPMSNNGEYTSFPVPFAANSELDYQEIKMTDTKAYALSEDVEDIPAGVGFCLYVKRDCLDAVGLLNESISGGYLEDLDFSMRARENGLRNVCATNVFVGHCGARSFTTRKRALVVKNLRQITSKFPNHAAESAAFVAMDPLQKYRRNLEASLILTKSFQSIIFHSSTVTQQLLVTRVFDHRSRGRKVLLVEIDTTTKIKLKDPDGGVPQSLECDLSVVSDMYLMTYILEHQKDLTFEMIDVPQESATLLALIQKHGIEIQIFVSRPLCQNMELFNKLINRNAGEIPSRETGRNSNIDNIVDESYVEYQRGLKSNDRKYWTRILPIDERALSEIMFVSSPDNIIIDRSKMWPRSARRLKSKNLLGNINLAIVDVKGSPEEFLDLMELVKAFAEKEFEYRVVIFGKTFYDISIMKSEKFFIKGRTCISEFEDQFMMHGINSVLSIPRARSYYEDYDLTSSKSTLPYSRFSYTREYATSAIVRSRPFRTPTIERSGEEQTERARNKTSQINSKLENRSSVPIEQIDDLIISNNLSSAAAANEIASWVENLLTH